MLKFLTITAAALAMAMTCANAGDYLETLKNDPTYRSAYESELETLTKLDPEASQLRKQYKQWMWESNLRQADDFLIADLESAVNLMAYNKHCASINESKLHRAEIFLRAFPEYYDQANRSAMFGRFGYRDDGYTQFCRWMNPTPKPGL